MAVPVVVHELFDGKQLAFLERKGDHRWSAASLPIVCAHRGDRCVDCPVPSVHVDHYRDGLSGVRRGGSACIFMGQTTAALRGVVQRCAKGR